MKQIKGVKRTLVVGNGPSYTEIDFRMVPKDADVFRMTAFFFEDKYYVGKNVDYFLDYYVRLENQYFNLHCLNETGQYNVNKNNIYITVATECNEHFPTVIPATPILHKNKAIAEFRKFYEYYYGHYLTTGITAVGLAVCLGFKEIYLAGFDFYSDENKFYPYDTSAKSGLQSAGRIIHSTVNSIYHTVRRQEGESIKTAVLKNHPTEMAVKFLELLHREYPSVKFYSVSQASPITKLISFIRPAPIIYKKPWYSPQPKPENAIKDWLPLPETMPKLREQKNKS
ncbi:MAG: hypothetical protein LBV16_01845 [Elusimicrobiota bacterium]|jgi:alpha-2,3 sialyltransferase|nr:hypothetical protein [Elusimicrobiota bacterium]